MGGVVRSERRRPENARDNAHNGETRANTGPSNAKRRPSGRRMLLTDPPKGVRGKGQVAPQNVGKAI
jgi:hypothetical protein